MFFAIFLLKHVYVIAFSPNKCKGMKPNSSTFNSGIKIYLLEKYVENNTCYQHYSGHYFTLLCYYM